MLAFIDLPDYVGEIYENNKDLAEEILPFLSGRSSDINLKAGNNLLSFDDFSLIYIREGLLRFVIDEKVIRFYTNSEIVFPNDNPIFSKSILISEFEAELTVCTKDNLEVLMENRDFCRLISQYRTNTEALLLYLASAYLKSDVQPSINLKRYEKGDSIIIEGDNSAEIFVMIEGEADVLLKGVKVGEIKENEVFGEFGFFMEQRRSASVKARMQCLVNVLNKDDFALLVKNRPEMTIAIAKSMANRIVKLNESLLKNVTI